MGWPCHQGVGAVEVVADAPWTPPRRGLGPHDCTRRRGGARSPAFLFIASSSLRTWALSQNTVGTARVTVALLVRAAQEQSGPGATSPHDGRRVSRHESRLMGRSRDRHRHGSRQGHTAPLGDVQRRLGAQIKIGKKKSTACKNKKTRRDEKKISPHPCTRHPPPDSTPQAAALHTWATTPTSAIVGRGSSRLANLAVSGSHTRAKVRASAPASSSSNTVYRAIRDGLSARRVPLPLS